MSDQTKNSYKVFLEKDNYKKAKVLILETQQDCSFLFESNGDDESSKKRLYSYKWILSAVSPVFQAMFEGGFQESVKSMDIKIDDIAYEDFEVFLDYVYNGSKNVRSWPKNSWDALPYIANKYLMPKMLNDLRKHAFAHTDIFTKFKWYQPGKGIPVVDIYSENLANGPRLAEMDLETFVAFMDFVRLNNVPLKHEFEIVEAFIKSKGYDVPGNEVVRTVIGVSDKSKTIEKSHREILENLLGLIDFEKMDANEFIDGPGNSTVLSTEQKYSIVSKIIQNSVSYNKKTAKGRSKIGNK